MNNVFFRLKYISTHCTLEDLKAILKMQFSTLFFWFVTSYFLNEHWLYSCIYTSPKLCIFSAQMILLWNNFLKLSTCSVIYNRHSLYTSLLVQVTVWSQQAMSHYLRQSWPLSMLSYRITQPQWVNSSLLQTCILHLIFDHIIFPSHWNYIVPLT